MSYTRALAALTTREAVTDTIYRVLIGLDRHDASMFNSAFAGDNIIFELRDRTNTKVINTVSTLRKDILDRIGPMDTSHMITNVRVDVKDGDHSAILTSLVLAQHAPPGHGKDQNGLKYLVGAEYEVNLEKDEGDGLWKIKKWVIDTIWTQGDSSMMPK